MPSDDAPQQTQPPTIDAKRLIAGLRARDAVATRQAYARTFGSEMGRAVLAHFLMECGVGRPITAETDAQLRELVGRHNAALDLADAASFGQPDLVVMVLTDTLETETHGHETRDDPPAAVYDHDDDDL